MVAVIGTPTSDECGCNLDGFNLSNSIDRLVLVIYTMMTVMVMIMEMVAMMVVVMVVVMVVAI